MSGSRISLLPVDEAKEICDDVDIPAYASSLNLNRALLHHPRATRNLVRHLFDLVYNHRVDPRLRELAVLRVSWLTACEYEWAQHWALATHLGIPEADIVGVREWRSHDGFSPLERAVLAAADDAVVHGAIEATTWAELAAHLDEAKLVEVTLVVTGWRMVASVLQSLEVPLDDDLERWPPDGRGPTEAATAR